MIDTNKQPDTWMRHYELLLWINTGILSAIMIVVMFFSVTRPTFIINYTGFVLTFISFYFIANFKELYNFHREIMRKGDEEWDEMDKKRKFRKQWFVFLMIFIVLIVFWTMQLVNHSENFIWQISFMVLGFLLVIFVVTRGSQLN